MALSQEGVKFSDFVKGLTAATESDLAAGNNMPIVTASSVKKIGGENVAKESLLSSLIFSMKIEKSSKYKELGFLKSDGTLNESSYRGVTDYIDVEGLQAIRTKENIASIANESGTFACFYDSEKIFLESAKASTSDNVVKDIFVPSEAKYVRFTLKNYTATAVFEVCGGEITKEIDNKVTKELNTICLHCEESRFEFGYLLANGNVNYVAYRGVTDFIDVKNIVKINVLSGVASIGTTGNTFACLYDENKNFIKNVTYTSSVNDVVATIEIPDNSKYIRFTLNTQDTIANFDLVGGGITEIIFEKTDPRVSKLEESTCFYGDSRIYNSIKAGWIKADGTEADPTSTSSKGITDFIDISGSIKIKTISGIAAAANQQNTFACFYDENKVFIAPSVKYTSAIEELKAEFGVPKNAKYIRFTTSRTTRPATFACESFDGLEYHLLKKKSNFGKSLALFGASTTELFNNYGMASKWIEGLGLSSFNFYGRGGATFSNQSTNNVQNQVDTHCSSEVVCDIYVLWFGVNDFYQGWDIGSESDYTSEDNYDESKRASQNGGLNYCIKKLYEHNPNATIVVFTSLPEFDNIYGWKKSHDPNNRTMFDYVEGQKKVSKRWGFSCLDQFSECGFNELNYRKYYKVDLSPEDRVHMYVNGYEKIVGKQIDFLGNVC